MTSTCKVSLLHKLEKFVFVYFLPPGEQFAYTGPDGNWEMIGLMATEERGGVQACHSWLGVHIVQAHSYTLKV